MLGLQSKIFEHELDETILLVFKIVHAMSDLGLPLEIVVVAR